MQVEKALLEQLLTNLDTVRRTILEILATGEPYASEFPAFAADFRRAVAGLWGKEGVWDEREIDRLYRASRGDFLTVLTLLKKVRSYQKQPDVSQLPRYLTAIFAKKGLVGVQQELGLLDPPQPSEEPKQEPVTTKEPVATGDPVISFSWGKAEPHAGNGTVVHLLNQVVEEAVRAYPNGR